MTSCQTLTVDMSNVERVSGASVRRRERRLRSWLTHERQTVRMVLAETFHHSSAPFKTKFKEEWVERHEQHEALRGQNTARTREATYCTSKTSVGGDTAFFSLYDEEDAVWGTRPLVEPRGRKSGSSGTPWSRLPSLHPSSRFSTPGRMRCSSICTTKTPQGGDQIYFFFGYLALAYWW